MLDWLTPETAIRLFLLWFFSLLFIGSFASIVWLIKNYKDWL